MYFCFLYLLILKAAESLQLNNFLQMIFKLYFT